MFIYPIYNHSWRNISTIYIYKYKTRLASNEIFSSSNKIHREVGRAKDLSEPPCINRVISWKTTIPFSYLRCIKSVRLTLKIKRSEHCAKYIYILSTGAAKFMHYHHPLCLFNTFLTEHNYYLLTLGSSHVRAIRLRLVIWSHFYDELINIRQTQHTFDTENLKPLHVSAFNSTIIRLYKTV